MKFCVKTVSITFFAAFICTVNSPSVAFGDTNNAMISWGDNSFVYGKGVDSAMDTPEGIQRLMARLKGRGYSGIYLRTDLAQLDPNELVYHPLGMDPFVALQLKRGVDDVNESFDIATIAQQAAAAVNLDYWAYHFHLYSDGAPASEGWTYHMKYLDDAPEEISIDRTGKKHYMVWEYAYPGARAAKVQEFVYMAETFGIKHFIPDMRTEAAQLVDQYHEPDRADQYGFNQIIVDEMLGTYGVNIMTDPRFDVYDAGFDPCDVMVENWRVLRGGYLTQLFRDIRTTLDAVDPAIKITARIPGDRVGSELGNWIIDWRTWVDEGLVDALVVPTPLAAGLFYNPAGRGYLPTAVSIATYRNYINASSNPNVELIHGGGWEYFPTTPPSGTDGWQTFWTCEAFDVAWFQRWQQWKQDIEHFGYIKFIEQNFDDFSLATISELGAEGEARYDPELRASPGAWIPLGDGSDNLPTVQETIKRGTTGKSLKIIREFSENTSPWVRRLGGVDHSRFQASVDNVISNGRCTFEFWHYRTNNLSSLAAFIQNVISAQFELGLWIQSGINGPVRYWDGTSWVTTVYTMPTGQWERFMMDVDLETQTYSGYMGENNENTLFTNVPYSVTENWFDRLFISTAGPDGNVTYIDDVLVKWYPRMSFTPEAGFTYLEDDFESHAVDATIHNTAPPAGSNWGVSPPASAPGYFVENDLSFGDGYKSLAATRDASASTINSSSASKLTLDPSYIITVDFDVLLKAGYSTEVSLKKSAGGPPTAGIKAATGQWQYWNGAAYAGSGVSYTDFDGSCHYWHHVQIALNCFDETYTIVVQSIGEMPILVGTYPWDPGSQPGDEVFFEIAPQGSTGQTVYFDNIKITYGPPCPLLDQTGDCKIDYRDFAKITASWSLTNAGGDLNQDGTTNLEDLNLLIGEWLARTEL
jgi:hypothetical protein